MAVTVGKTCLAAACVIMVMCTAQGRHYNAPTRHYRRIQELAKDVKGFNSDVQWRPLQEVEQEVRLSFMSK